MRILGIDYGESKVGVALATTPIPEPHSVIRAETEDKLVNRLKNIVHQENIEQIVVGVSEGESGQRAHEFGITLGKKLGLPVEFEDETLSTYDAIASSFASAMTRKKRRAMEDAYSAAIILARFIDRSIQEKV